MPPAAQPSSGRRPRGAAASLEKRHQRILDVAQLDAASEAVESLRAALSAAAASEEASRLEVAGLQAQIKAFRAEEEGRFQHQLRQQAELMRLRLRIGELSEQLGDRDSVTECAVIDVRCLQQELHHAEQRAKELTAELSSQRMHTQAQQKALHAAREREAADHRARLGEHSAQLEALREAMTSSQRVDPRKYLELLEPTYQRLAEGVKYERDMADALGHAWVAAEVEEAREAAVTAEVKLATSERAYLDGARLREEQHARRLEGVKASAASQVDELKEYIATLVTELQEKDASARQAQQSVLDQLHAERATFHASLRGMQEQLAAARSEVARKGRVQNRMLAKVMAAWDRRRLHRITLGWRAAVVRARMEAAGGLERRVHAAEVRLTASSMLIAEQRWRQVGLSRAFAQLRVFCDAVRAARTRPLAAPALPSQQRPPAASRPEQAAKAAVDTTITTTTTTTGTTNVGIMPRQVDPLRIQCPPRQRAAVQQTNDATSAVHNVGGAVQTRHGRRGRAPDRTHPGQRQASRTVAPGGTGGHKAGAAGRRSSGAACSLPRLPSGVSTAGERARTRGGGDGAQPGTAGRYD